MDHNTGDKQLTDNIKLTRLPKKTYQIDVVVPKPEIDEQKKSAIEKVQKEIEIKGFRKGKAPENLVLDSVNPRKIKELILENIIPLYYKKAVDKLDIKPIVSPKIELVSTKDDDDWQIKFTVCEMPDVNLGNYKEEIKNLFIKDKIWTPGLSSINKDEKEEEKRSKKLENIFKWFSENIKVDISDMLIEDEVNKKLSGLLAQTQKLGITIDEYLSSTNKTIDSIKSEYRLQVENSLKNEFIIGKIAEEENVTVNQEEIEKTISATKNEAEKKQMESNKYLIAILLRQQKTLDFLASL